MENKSVPKYNFLDFSYKFDSIDEYFGEKYSSQLQFNQQIELDVKQRRAKRLPFGRKIEFVDVKTEREKLALKIQLSPLQFLNLFYHELDFIIENKSKPRSIIPRLDTINLFFIDKLYFYSMLIEALISKNDNQLIFIANEIEKQYDMIFDFIFGDKNSAKESALKVINTYNEVLDSIESTDEILKMLIDLKYVDCTFHHDIHINQFIFKSWLLPKIEYYQELKDRGINELEVEISEDIIAINKILKSENNYESNPEKQHKLSINQIALKCVYEGLQITRENGNEIIKRFGHKSGEKLFQRYIYYSSPANRKGKPNPCTQKTLANKIRLVESVICLLSKEKQGRALDELSILKRIEESEYQ
jgi:hypothetical protein